LNTLVLTPTHKAAGVLIAKGVKNVYTIHSVLKLVPTINQNFRRGQKMQTLQKVGDTDLSKITDIFIDEYSMINTSILDMLIEVLPKHANLTVFGDFYQLPPVDGEAVEPLKYTKNIEELTVQYRAKAPNVVDSFMRFMYYLKDGSVKDLTLSYGPDLVKGDLSDFNPLTDRALAFTNECVLQMNDEIASHLNLPKEFSYDEDLVINGIDCKLTKAYNGISLFPKCLSKGRLMEEKKLISTSIKTLKEIKMYKTDLSRYDRTYITVDETVYEIYYDREHYKTLKELKRNVEDFQQKVIDYHYLDDDVNVPQWCKSNPGARFVRERGKAWQDYIAHQNLVFDFRRPFATTVHKSQGSEFSTVFINQNDIKKAIRGNYYGQYARLMYVALSRAIDKVVIV